jgi:CheY-like chemotaxis protein
VVCAASLPEALSALAAQQMAPNVALVDLQLDDGLDGFAVVAALRAAFGADLPAALISADRSDAVRAAAREQGIVPMPKPVRIAAPAGAPGAMPAPHAGTDGSGGQRSARMKRRASIAACTRSLRPACGRSR